MSFRRCSLDLLGFGCSRTSVWRKIFSVQFFVESALARRFSKWASNSVFSAWPNFSSVNCRKEVVVRSSVKKKQNYDVLQSH